MNADLIEQLDALAAFYRAAAREASLTAADTLTAGARYRLLRRQAGRLENLGDSLYTGALTPMAAQSELDDLIELFIDHGMGIPA